MLREALSRIDDNLIIQEQWRLKSGNFTARLSDDVLVLQSELVGSGGIINAGLAVELAKIVHSGYLDALLCGQAKISFLGKGASRSKLRKMLSRSSATVRTELLFQGNIKPTEGALEPYRRRLESTHEWTKAVNSDIPILAKAELSVYYKTHNGLV